MKVRVKFFALYRELVGLRETQVDLPPGSTALDLWNSFARGHPSLAPNLPHTRFAVNGEYTDTAVPLKEGDEVVFIPPVSGGDDGLAVPPVSTGGMKRDLPRCRRIHPAVHGGSRV